MYYYDYYDAVCSTFADLHYCACAQILVSFYRSREPIYFLLINWRISNFVLTVSYFIIFYGYTLRSRSSVYTCCNTVINKWFSSHLKILFLLYTLIHLEKNVPTSRYCWNEILEHLEDDMVTSRACLSTDFDVKFQ